MTGWLRGESLIPGVGRVETGSAVQNGPVRRTDSASPGSPATAAAPTVSAKAQRPRYAKGWFNP